MFLYCLYKFIWKSYFNPCEDPANSLRKYGIDEHILSKFEPIVFHPEKDFYFIAFRDEVITTSIIWIFQPDVFLYDSQ